MTQCWLCLNDAGWIGSDRNPDDERAKQIPVCGLHMVAGDKRMDA